MLDEETSALKEFVPGTCSRQVVSKWFCCINLSPRGKEYVIPEVGDAWRARKEIPGQSTLSIKSYMVQVNLMASCTYSKLVAGPCGPSTTNPANVECIAIGDCTKDIVSHLVYCKISDDCVDSEANLLLARAGKILSCCNKQRSILPENSFFN